MTQLSRVSSFEEATTNVFRENMSSIEYVKYELTTTFSLTCVFTRAKGNIDGQRYLAILLIVTSTYSVSQMMAKGMLKNFFSKKYPQRNKG